MTQATMFPVGMSDHVPPPIEEIDFEGFRRQLARMVDGRLEVAKELDKWGMELSVRFCATLAGLYGHKNHKTKWRRISDALTASRAKTVGPDVDIFISLVLEFINADPGFASSSRRMRDVIEKLTGKDGANPEERQLWIDNLCAKRFVILSRAKEQWEKYLGDKRTGADLSWWNDDVDFEEFMATLESEGGDA